MNAFDHLATPLPTGITVVEASAGTGKTFALTHVVVRELLAGRVEPDQVLLVTFTNAATDELAGRLRDLLRACDRRLRGVDADAGLDAFLAACAPDRPALARRAALLVDAADRIAVRTIHGFCADVLADEAFAAGLPFDLELLAEDAELRERAAGTAWRRLHARHPVLVLLPDDAETAVETAWMAHQRPGTRLVPPDADLAAGAADLTAARQGLAAAWTPMVIAAIEALAWPNAVDRPNLARDPDLRAALATLAGGDDGAIAPATWKALAALTGPAEDLFLIKPPGSAERWLATPLPAALRAILAAADALRHRRIAALAAEAEAERRHLAERARIRTTDDLLREVDEALSDPARGAVLAGRLAERWRLVCVDEFQDTDRRQWDIFRRAFAHQRLLVIGDPKQSIYAFRGADVRVYGAARGLGTCYGLGTNRRSAAGIVHAVDALFTRHPLPYADPALAHTTAQALPEAPLRLIDHDPQRQAVHLWTGTDLSPERAIATVVAELVRLLAGGAMLAGAKAGPGGRRALGPGDCCVLVRTNREAAAVQDTCAAAGIPAVLAAAGDVLESAEARELALVLAGVLAPGSRDARTAAATVLWGCTAADLRAAADDPALWSALLAPFALVAEVWRTRGIGAALDRLFAERGTFARLAPLPGAERRIANLRHLGELLARRERDGNTPPERLAALLAHPDHATDGERELRLESDAAKVRVMTVHRAKGLEFPVVLLPTLWLDGPRDPQGATAVPDGDGWALHLTAKGIDDAAWLRFELGESARRLYVAMTRAQARLGLVCGSGPATDSRGRAHAIPARRHLRALALGGLGWQLLAPGQDAEAWMGERWREAQGSGKEIEPILAALAASAQNAITAWATACGASTQAVAEWPAITAIPRPAAEPAVAPRARSLDPATAARLTDPWRTTSFTGLIRDAQPALQPSREPEAADGEPVEERGPLAGFAGGAEAGEALHDVIEHWDPAAAPDPDAIAVRLDRHGLGAGSLRHAADCDPLALVDGLLRRLAMAPLLPAGGGGPLRLAATAAAERRCEWDFHLPLGRFRAADLAEAIRLHDPELQLRCGPALASLGDRPVHGYLKGFVDLLVQHDGRLHVIDWKSNRLGAQPEDYTDERMWEAMAHSHYAVQAVLYLVAVHRWQRATRPDYDPARHLGGAWYVFLRGLAADGSTGVLALRPTTALIDDLDRRIGGPP